MLLASKYDSVTTVIYPCLHQATTMESMWNVYNGVIIDIIYADYDIGARLECTELAKYRVRNDLTTKKNPHAHVRVYMGKVYVIIGVITYRSTLVLDDRCRQLIF